jgi:hypothetical protein
MIHNNQSLEWVTEQLAAGKNITKSQLGGSPLRQSPVRSPTNPYASSPTNRDNNGGLAKGKSPTRSPARKAGPSSPSRPSAGVSPKLAAYKPNNSGLPNPMSSPGRSSPTRSGPGGANK